MPILTTDEAILVQANYIFKLLQSHHILKDCDRLIIYCNTIIPNTITYKFEKRINNNWFDFQSNTPYIKDLVSYLSIINDLKRFKLATLLFSNSKFISFTCSK